MSATGRDRYIDTLRAAALVRVITYHLLAWTWLPMLFPSMGIMFALAGSLVASSLDRRSHWTVLRSRGRRLLVPLWAAGVVAVPLMLWQGWSGLHPATLLFWVAPFSSPPGSSWGTRYVSHLWYLRSYLWFLLLSPAALWCFRRWPLRTAAVPLGVLALLTTGIVVPNGSRTDEVVQSVAVYGTCWLLGFAHHDGRIRRLPLRAVLPVAAALLGTGGWWTLTHPDPTLGANLDAVPFGNALYCLGGALLLLRVHNPLSWVQRIPLLDKAISALNARAMTVYLWGNVAIGCGLWVEHTYVVGRVYPHGHVALSRTVQLAITWLVVAGLVLALGWVEDVAAKRAPRLLPWPRVRRDQAVAATRLLGLTRPVVPAQSPPLVIDLRDAAPVSATA